MQKIFKNKYFLFLKAVPTNMTKILNIYFKQNKKRLLLLIPENTADRVFIVRKTKMLTEYKRKEV